MPGKRRRHQGHQHLMMKMSVSRQKRGLHAHTCMWQERNAWHSLLYDKSREVKVVLTLRVWASAVAPMGVMSL